MTARRDSALSHEHAEVVPLRHANTFTAEVHTGRSYFTIFQMCVFGLITIVLFGVNITGFVFCVGGQSGCAKENFEFAFEPYTSPDILIAVVIPLSVCLVIALSLRCCRYNKDRGCCRNNRATMYRDEYTYLFLSFYGVEIIYFIGNILVFFILARSATTLLLIVGIVSLALTFLVHIYKFKIRKDDTYKGKMKRVITTVVLLGVEDTPFMLLKVIALFGNGTNSDDPFIIASYSMSIVIILFRVLGLIRHGFCGSPVYDKEIHGDAVAENVVVLIGNPDEPNALENLILSNVPIEELMDNAFQGIKIKIKKEGYCAFFAFGVLPAFVSFVLVALFIAAIIIDASSPGLVPNSIFENDVFFIGIVTAAFVLFVLAVCLYFCCLKMDRGACLRDRDLYVTPLKKHAVFSTRSLEIADYISDIGSVIIIYDSFPQNWQILMILSLVLSGSLNFAYYLLVSNDSSYQGKKKSIALSLGLLSAEDLIMVPINFGYIFAVDDNTNQVELAAVGIATLVGFALLFIRGVGAFSHLLYGAPVFTRQISRGVVNEIDSTTRRSIPRSRAGTATSADRLSIPRPRAGSVDPKRNSRRSSGGSRVSEQPELTAFSNSIPRNKNKKKSSNSTNYRHSGRGFAPDRKSGNSVQSDMNV